MPFPLRRSIDSGPLTATDHLRDVQIEHDAIRCSIRAGVSAEALASDNLKWEIIGDAICDLADMIARECAASAFCDSRPDIPALTARLSEAIDDLIDEPAWMVIDAAARVAAWRGAR